MNTLSPALLAALAQRGIVAPQQAPAQSQLDAAADLPPGIGDSGSAQAVAATQAAPVQAAPPPAQPSPPAAGAPPTYTQLPASANALLGGPTNANADAATGGMTPDQIAALDRANAQAAEAKAAGAAAPAPGAAPKAEGVFAQPGGGAAARPPVSLAFGGAGAAVPAHAVSMVSPDTRAAIDRAGADKLAATDQAAAAETGGADAQAQAVQGIADTLAAQRASMARIEDARKKAYDAQAADYQRLQREAAEGKIQPESMGFMGALAVGLGAFGSALSHTQNYALEVVNKRIDENMAAQRTNLENKNRAAESAKGGLAEMRARFGDDRVADAAERARQLEQAKAAGDVMVARAQSPMLAAKWAGVRAGIEAEQAAQHAQMEKWIPAQATGGGMTQAAVTKLAGDLLMRGVYKNPDDATNAAVRILSTGRAGTSEDRVPAGGGKTSARIARRQAELDEADKAGQRLETLLRDGSSLSMSQRAQAAADANVLRRAGFTNVPEDPLTVWSSSTARAAGVSEVRRAIQSERKSLVEHGTAGGEEAPEDDADRYIRPAGEGEP